MSTFASKLNKNKPVFNVDTTDFNYIKLADLYNSKEHGGKDAIHVINGVFINESQYGPNPVIISEQYKALINLPKHMAGAIKEILADPELVQVVKDGKAGFKIYTYESHNRECYSINFVDL
jgi:hypothetical protein